MTQKSDNELAGTLRSDVESRANSIGALKLAAVYERAAARASKRNLNSHGLRRIAMPLAAAALVAVVIAGATVPRIARKREYRHEMEAFVLSLYSERIVDDSARSEDPINILFNSWNLLPVTDD